MASAVGRFDVSIVGGGIVGLACARELLIRRPKLRVVILEKETHVGMHQSSHNSGVIHAGIYYKPGSLRARLCTQGLDLMYAFCEEHGVATRKTGKLIVATEPWEIEPLKALMERGTKNGVKDLVYLATGKEVRKLEPSLSTALAAIHSPHTGVVDYGAVTSALARDVVARGAVIRTNQPMLESSVSDVLSLAPNVITCGGLYADRISVALGGAKYPVLIPVRGDFVRIAQDNVLRSCMIYPVPNPAFPFLGVHLTKKVSGEVWAGPNAMLATHREGYYLSDFNIRDFAEIIKEPGFWKLALPNTKWALSQLASGVSKGYFMSQVAKFVPELSASDAAGRFSGVRALAVNEDGSISEDFLHEKIISPVDGKTRILNIRNAPSPAATSSLALAKEICNIADTHLLLN